MIKNKPMLLPERFPKMLPLNGGLRYPASVMRVTVSKMQMVIITIIDVTDRLANIMIAVFFCCCLFRYRFLNNFN